MTLNNFIQRVFVINLKRRTDRRELAEKELAISGIDPNLIEWVEGFDYPQEAHAGCTKSHRDLLRRVASGPWERVLVLEDDFKVLTLDDLIEGTFISESVAWQTFHAVLGGKGNLAERFEAMSEFLPPTADVIYFGGGYGEAPISRFNKHVLRCGAMLTTSSYIITRGFAKTWTEATDHHVKDCVTLVGTPIDYLFSRLAHESLYYILQPRLIFQRFSKSDITGMENSYLQSMVDPSHEGMIPQ